MLSKSEVSQVLNSISSGRIIDFMSDNFPKIHREVDALPAYVQAHYLLEKVDHKIVLDVLTDKYPGVVRTWHEKNGC